MALMELRAGWRGLLIFGVLVIIVSAGMPQIFPTYRDSLVEELEGANNVHIDVPEGLGGVITLTWEPLANATSYLVLEDTRVSMVTATLKYTGTNTTLTFEKDFEEKRYYAVMAMVNEASTPALIGVAATEKGKDPFQELMQNPAYAGFTGGKNISMLEVKGFITLEFFSWWWMLAGLFIAYLSASFIAGDFENKRMDLIFSTPISRRRYVLEKFSALSIISLFVVVVAVMGLTSGLASIGVLKEFPADTVFFSLIGCVPFLMVIAAVGILAAVLFQKVRSAMGITFAFVFTGFFLFTFGSFSKSLSWMKTISFFTYWDYASVIVDNLFKPSDLIILVALAGVLLGVGIWLFERNDIPA
jgi:ABC-2 type transport system permease protein